MSNKTFSLDYSLHYNRYQKLWYVVHNCNIYYIKKVGKYYKAAGKSCKTLRDSVIAILVKCDLLNQSPF